MIHVCYGLRDESGNYSKHTGTSIQSLLDNTKEEVTIHLIHDSTLTDKNQNTLAGIVYDHNQSVEFYNVEKLVPKQIEFIQNKIPKAIKYWATIAGFYRCLVLDLFPREIDRMIYLDSDIVVNLDINEMWQIDLKGRPLAAMPQTPPDAEPANFQRNFAVCKSGIIDPHDYFNSGVLMMDLNWLRSRGGGISADSLLNRCVTILAEHPDYSYVDQDALNVFFANNFVKLPVKFNTPVLRVLRDPNFKIEKVIYHAWGLVPKAFPDFNNPYYQLWFKYFCRTPFFNMDSFGNLWNSFEDIFNKTRNLAIDRINLLQKICKLSATRSRVFCTIPKEVDKIRDLLGNDSRDIFFDVSNSKAFEILIQDAQQFSQKRFYCLFIDDKICKDLQKKLSDLKLDCFNIRILFETIPELQSFKNQISQSI